MRAYRRYQNRVTDEDLDSDDLPIDFVELFFEDIEYDSIDFLIDFREIWRSLCPHLVEWEICNSKDCAIKFVMDDIQWKDPSPRPPATATLEELSRNVQKRIEEKPCEATLFIFPPSLR
jgi:hypothetical protein